MTEYIQLPKIDTYYPLLHMPTHQIRINKTKDIAALLDMLRSKYKFLSDAELMKVALSLAYEFLQKQRIDTWIDSLPTMELTDEQQESLSEGIRSMEEERVAGRLKTMTAEELVDEIKNHTD